MMHAGEGEAEGTCEAGVASGTPCARDPRTPATDRRPESGAGGAIDGNCPRNNRNNPDMPTPARVKAYDIRVEG